MPPEGLTNVTLWIFKLKGSHNAHAWATSICQVFRMYGMHPSPLQYEPPQTQLAKGSIGQLTDISQMARGCTSDDGGGGGGGERGFGASD